MSWLFIAAGSHRRQPARWTRVLVLGILFSALAPAHSQEALRASLSGEAAAEARRREIENTAYNFKIGPMKLRFMADLFVAATDNLNLTPVKPESDVSVSPALHVAASWPVTEQNVLSLSMGVGYTRYLKHSELDYLFITPDSELAFNIVVGQFLITLHNALSISQQAYNQPALTRTANYNVFDDTAGVTVSWDMSESLILTLDLNHETASYSPAEFAYQDHVTESAQLRAAWVLSHETQVGLEVGASLVDYSRIVGSNSTIPTNSAVNTNIFLSDLVSYNIGPFLRSRLSQYISVSLSAGYTLYSRDKTNSFGEKGDTSALYVAFTLDHRVNESLRYTFSAGRSITLGIYSSTLDLYYARWNPVWQLFPKVSIQTPFFYEYALQGGKQAETAQRFGAGLDLSYQLTEKLTTLVSYNYVTRSSNLSQNYDQNRLVLDLRYSF